MTSVTVFREFDARAGRKGRDETADREAEVPGRQTLDDHVGARHSPRLSACCGQMSSFRPLTVIRFQPRRASSVGSALAASSSVSSHP